METSGALFCFIPAHVAQPARLCLRATGGSPVQASAASDSTGLHPLFTGEPAVPRESRKMAAQLQQEIQMYEGINRERGFTLIELLVVVAVVLVLAVIAVPNLLRSRIAANEASAVQSLRQISTAEMTYSGSFPSIGYAPDLASLGGPVSGCTPDPTHACVLDGVISAGSKSGYKFFAAGFMAAGGPTNSTFVASSAPLNFNTTGVRMFCIATDDGVVRWKQGRPGAVPAPDVPTCIAYSLM